MPEPSPDEAKLSTLEEMLRDGKKIRFTEVVAIYWPLPDGTVFYAHTKIDEVEGFKTIPLAPIQARIITDSNSPFSDIPETADISDATVEYNLSDLDGEISRLCWQYGAGLKVEIFEFYPDVDLTISQFVGMLHSPKDANGITLKTSATQGFRSFNLSLPRRLPTPSCPFIFGGLLPSQEEINLHQGCPYNAHLGGSIGVPGWTDCTRDSAETCLAHITDPITGQPTKRFFGGFRTVIEAVQNNQTKGPNLLAIARGNESTLTEPIRVVAGERLLKALRLMAFRPENDTNHPDKGWVAAQFECGEGPFAQLWDARINNVVVGAMHLNIRTGELGQAATAFSPNFGTYSGTGLFFGRIQGDFRNVSASSLSGSIRARGLKNVPVYTEPGVFTEEYTTNRADWLLFVLTNKRWGYGEDVSRYDIQSVIDTAAWCDEVVAFTDLNGNDFSGVRSTFNAELVGRATQTQIEDICTAGQIAPPFEHNGKKIFYPLGKEEIDDDVIPYFTDYGSDVNIVAQNGKPLLSWSYTGDDELINEWTVSFDDASNSFTSTPIKFGDQLQQLKAGKAYGDTTIRIINKDIAAFGITNMAEAARFGNSLLYLGPLHRGGISNNFEIKFTTWATQALRVRMHKLLRVRFRALDQLFQKLGIEGFSYFRVKDRKRKGNLFVEITAQAYPIAYWDTFETVVQIPPAIVGVNAGGGSHDIPFSVGFSFLTHTDDQIRLAITE